MCRKLAPWMAVCAWWLVATGAFADGVFMDGLSPRSLARGGTNQGFADNGSIVYDNPAAMVNVCGDGLIDVGIDSAIISGHYAEPGTSVYSSFFCPLPQIGIIKKSADGNWAMGLAAVTPAGFSERFNMDGPVPLTGNRRYESFAALVKVPFGLAYRVNDRLSIGGTVGVGICYADFEGPYFLNGPSLPGTPLDVRTHGSGADFIWSVGMQYLLTDDTTIGATYESSSPFRLNGNTAVDVPGLGPSSYASELHIEWPQSVAVGIKHCLCPHRTIAADVVWLNWASSFDHFVLFLHDPGTPAFPPQITDHFPLDWRDSVALRLGYEQVLASGLTMRLGYVYHPNPIPDSTLTPLIQGFMDHTFSVGFSKNWCGWDVDLAYQHMFNTRQHVGTSSLIGGDFNNSTQDAMVDIIGLSFMRPF